MSSTKLDHVLIIGGGITGLASALALNALNVRCTVYELRATPSTIGGAVNLTPSALRCLEHLGVLPHIQGIGCDTRSIEVFSTLTGHQLGELSFRNVDKFKYHARRISRAALLRGLLDTLEGTDVKIEYGKKLVALTETDVSVEATFDDGTSAKGDILLGCDGIHSNTRMKLVDPTRLPVYTGISTAYGTVPVSSIPSPLHFQDGALNSSRQGSLLTAFCDAKKETIYAAAVMEVKEQLNHEGWKVKGSDQDATRKELLSRFGDSKMPCLVEIVEKVEDLYFYPVNALPSGGKWSSKRAILLGDAAHAVCSFTVYNHPLHSFCFVDAPYGRKYWTCFRRRGTLRSNCRMPSRQARFRDILHVRRLTP